ncbi:hypothetical protein FB451DRAFT_1391397 [Mycena latifolia]|nr:hypothetical protein FB451DRAFT_1391397 [Mycena latifolia]
MRVFCPPFTLRSYSLSHPVPLAPASRPPPSFLVSRGLFFARRRAFFFVSSLPLCPASARRGRSRQLEREGYAPPVRRNARMNASAHLTAPNTRWRPTPNPSDNGWPRR